MALRHLFAQPWLLCSLAALPLLGLLGAWSAWRRKRALALLTGPISMERLRNGGWLWNTLRGLSLSSGLMLLAIGSAGPQWDRVPELTSPGRDLVAVLDCSRSMLAERPCRLERARRALDNLARDLKRHGGHRLALVVFATRAAVLCPLTYDYDHFLEALETFREPDSSDKQRAFAARLAQLDLGPGSGDPSGTRLGSGIDAAVSLADPRSPGTLDILLLSDGDDPVPDRSWEAAVARARGFSAPVFVLGVGDPENDSRLRPEYLRPGESPFPTRLQEAPLAEIAQLTQGEYFPARTESLALAALYRNRIAGRPLREQSDEALTGYRQQYPWFLLPAFLLLTVALLLHERGPKPVADPEKGSP
jgi:Ca-activated chloride channel family protein